MGAFVLINTTTLAGTSWTGTAPGPGNPTISGTVASSTDFSDHIAQVSIDESLAMEGFTTFGDAGFVVEKPGLMSGGITLDFNQDFASSSVNAVFGAAFLARTLLYIDVKATSSARGATNPSFVYAAYVQKYPPIAQAVGSRAAVSVDLRVTGSFTTLTS